MMSLRVALLCLALLGQPCSAAETKSLPRRAASPAAARLVGDGVKALLKRRYAEAERLFTRALEKDPKNASALANRHTARYERGDCAGALFDFEAAASLEKGVERRLAGSAAGCYRQRARGFLQLRRYEEAARDSARAQALERLAP